MNEVVWGLRSYSRSRQHRKKSTKNGGRHFADQIQVVVVIQLKSFALIECSGIVSQLPCRP
jgi:hypothetical protein